MRAPRPSRATRGFTLIEVALAVAIGVTLLGASVMAYRGVQQSSRFAQARSMVGTIQTNIGMDKFRRGTPPTLAALQSNLDSAGKPFWPSSTAFPADPIVNDATISPFSSASAAVALTAGDAQNLWDNPVFTQSGYGNGGWLYDASTGAFRLDLSNQAYPDQRPGAW
jgi:prepilin-type N-terminal cleavage/methylation domain-containing protein